MKNLLKFICVVAVASAALCGVAQAAAGDPGACPVSWVTLQSKLRAAVTAVSGGSGYHMWGVVVNRNGTVCAVAYSGSSATSQWLLSRQIGAAKAFTANGLSLDGANKQLSTAQLDGTQVIDPTHAGALYGVHFGNIEDAPDLYKGPIASWGTAFDPLINRRVGGTITFGGGLALVQNGAVVGGLGISGDSACRDDANARYVRSELHLSNGDTDKYWSGPTRPACP